MSEAARVPVLQQVRGMKYNFWIANLIESFERLAFFGVRAVVGLYIATAQPGALDLTMTDKGLIFGIWALIQCLVPMVSGGYTDTYGYKKSMYTAYTINIVGYVMMANANGFWTMLASACMVGLGTAIFKPPVQGAVAKSLDEGNSGLGFGIFYWMVNIGGMLAPAAAAALRGDEANPTWSYVFYGAAIATAMNYIWTFFLFREPEINPEARKKAPFKVFAETMLTLWRDKPMLRFLMVISGFWFMFMQLWDLLPNFISEWVDARDIGAFVAGNLGEMGKKWLDANGALKPEMLINIDAVTIVALVLPLAWFFGRFRMMFALVVGMVIGLVGFTAAGLSMSGWFVAAMIFVFAIGEIICSPKFSEYIGMTAPADKKAIYMGYSNIPFAIGWAVGNWTSGPLYDSYSSRPMLARRYMVDQLGMNADIVNNADLLPNSQAVETMAYVMGGGDATAVQAKIQTAMAGLDLSNLPKEEAGKKVQEVFDGILGKVEFDAVRDATKVLWDAYDPWIIWVILGAIGLLSVFGILAMYIKSRQQDKAA